MAKQLSRRALVRGAVGTALATAAAPLMAQEKKDLEDLGLDVRVEALEKKLAHPLAPEVKKLTRTALKNLEQEMNDRLKNKLPGNSEPCFVFIPTPSA